MIIVLLILHEFSGVVCEYRIHAEYVKVENSEATLLYGVVSIMVFINISLLYK